MTEYLRAAKIKPSEKLATGLFHAIKTDTGNFERQTIIEDIRAFQFLYKYTNINLSQRIEQGEIRYDFLKYFEYALKNKRKIRDRIFVNLGNVMNPDVCVLIADFFIKVDATAWSVISGKFNQMLIVILRYNGFHNNAGKIAKKAFGNIGAAGGHKSMARAEIPLSVINNFCDIKDEKSVLKWMINRVNIVNRGKKAPSV